MACRTRIRNSHILLNHCCCVQIRFLRRHTYGVSIRFYISTWLLFIPTHKLMLWVIGGVSTLLLATLTCGPCQRTRLRFFYFHPCYLLRLHRDDDKSQACYTFQMCEHHEYHNREYDNSFRCDILERFLLRLFLLDLHLGLFLLLYRLHVPQTDNLHLDLGALRSLRELVITAS